MVRTSLTLSSPALRWRPVGEVEQHRGAMREDQGVADDVVHRPDLHVPGAGGIAKVDGVHHQHRLALLTVEFSSNAIGPERTNGGLVDGVDSRIVGHGLES